MRAGRALLLTLAVMAGAAAQTAEAASEPRNRNAAQARTTNATTRVAAMPAVLRGAPAGGRTALRTASFTGGISCVPYARMVTGMNISGDGRQWWHNAAATYARGRTPEHGAVLAFPGSGGMSRGHVAVVSRVVDSRTILIDHANWGGPGIRRGTVMRNVRVVDASDRNDWTAVRVQVGWDSAALGRTYPTYGFIYNRRRDGTVMASAGLVEVAEAPSPHVAQHLRLAETLRD
jgi:CHAP domain